MAVKKVFKLPKTLGACADLMYELKDEKRIAKKAVEAIETKEKALKAHVIETLPKSKAFGISGKVGCVTVITKEIPQVEDWSKFYKYVSKNKAFDLMQKRLSTGAIQERLDDGKKIPGVIIFKAVTVSLTKAK